MLCDFCSDSNVVKSYPTADFTAPAPFSNVIVEQISAGNWAACPTCADLVDRGAWEELTRRSVNTFYERNGHIIPRPVLVKAITRLHQEFREHRKVA
jgi:hypothetical protein